MQLKRNKRTVCTFYESALAFHEVYHVNTAVCFHYSVGGGRNSHGFNEFELVQSRSLHLSVIAWDRSYGVDKLTFYKFRVPVPLYVGKSVLKMYGTRLSVKIYTPPSPTS